MSTTLHLPGSIEQVFYFVRHAVCGVGDDLRDDVLAALQERLWTLVFVLVVVAVGAAVVLLDHLLLDVQVAVPGAGQFVSR